MNETKTIDSLAESWLAEGGVATDGTVYGVPDVAKPWGSAGCPLLPRSYRTRFGVQKAPPALSRIFGARNLTLGELDANVLRRFGLDELPGEGLNAIRDSIYKLPVPTGQVAIPTGVPPQWILSLPIRGRAYRAIRRIISPAGAEVPLEEPVSFEEFLQLRPVGRITLIDLLCVLESAELHLPPSGQSRRLEAAKQRIATAKFQRSVREAARDAIRTVSILGDDMRRFAAWALAETSAETIGDAVSTVLQDKESVEEWKSLARLKLDEVAGPPINPYAVLDAYVDELNAREKTIFRFRIAISRDRRTLRELGEELGTSRERIRQLETSILRKFSIFIQSSPDAEPIRWRVETLKRKLGIAAPLSHADALLPLDQGATDYSSLMLELAGPYDTAHGWLVRRSEASKDPTTVICGMADEFGRIDRDQAAEKLVQWGLDISLNTGWLTRDRKVRSFNGQLVLWGTSLGDRLAFALADLGHPATVDALLGHIREVRTRNSAVNALANEPRIVRVSPVEWALASWELPTYGGIALAIGSLLKESDKAMLIDEVVARLERTFGLSNISVRSYCHAPMFVVENGRVRLRADDESCKYPADALRSARGVFILGPRRVSLVLEVDHELFRGSGRRLTYAAGAALGVNVGEQMTFRTDNDSIIVTFPETSNHGPSLGSIRSLAEHASAERGHYMTLILDSSEMSATALSTGPADFEPGWQLVERLTGIASGQGINGLAQALQCGADEVRALLRSRGDEIVMAALPEASTSPGLERALADLEAQLRKARKN